MKGKDLILIGGLIAGGYLLYKYFSGGTFLMGGGGAGSIPTPLDINNLPQTILSTAQTGTTTPTTQNIPATIPAGYNLTRDVTGQQWIYPSNTFIKYAAGSATETQKLQAISKSLPPGTREKIVVSKILAGKI